MSAEAGIRATVAAVALTTLLGPPAVTWASDIGGAFVPRSWMTDGPLTPPSRAPVLTLVWFDVQRQLPSGFDAMATEVQTIFREIGVEVAWRTGGPGTTFGESAIPEIAVILLEQDPLPSRRRDRIMGLVRRDPQSARTVWAFASTMRDALGLPAGAGFTLDVGGTLHLARAMARVVAHEIVHALAPARPHAHDGLMRNALGRAQLLGARERLDPDCARAVVSGLAATRRTPPETAPASAAVADR